MVKYMLHVRIVMAILNIDRPKISISLSVTHMSLLLTLCTSSSIWDNFVTNSPQGSIFCRSAFLDALGVEYDLWFVEENGQPQAGAVILRRNAEPILAPYLFTLYQGLLFAGQSRTLPPHSRPKLTLEVTETLLKDLSERYDRLSFCLHYATEDLRGLQWFHYHEPHLGQFKMEMYYTGLIDLTASPDLETYLTTIRTTRRYEYRKALREGLTFEVSQDIDTLESLYRLTFERQGIELDADVLKRMRTITAAALSKGFGELMLCRDAAGVAASATLFLHDERCGYYLIGANHPDYRNSWSGTFLVLENIRRCQVRGLKWVDVCGINSPNRGDFKTSLNAVPTPYFVVTWERPSTGS